MKIKSCYIKKGMNYYEITYKMYKTLKKEDKEFKERYFISWEQSIFEVDEKTYKEINQMNNRTSYLQKLQHLHECQNIEEYKSVKEMKDPVFEFIQKKQEYIDLKRALDALNKEEKEIIIRIFFLRIKLNEKWQMF